MIAWCYTIPVQLLDRGQEAQGRWFPLGPKFVFTFVVNHFHVLSCREIILGELCCMWRSRRLYSQSNCRLYCTLHCCRYYCYSFCFSFLSHSFTVRRYTHSLTLARPLTPYAPYAHTPHALPYSWEGLRHSCNNGNCRCRRPIDRIWSCWCGSILDFQWVMLTTFVWRQKGHSLQALQKLDGRLFCLSFQLTEDISYCYIMLLINVLNLTM